MTIQEIMLRAQLLRQETALNSISPDRAGSIMFDTLAYINQMQLQGANPLMVSKIYDSVSAMGADDDPISDLTGDPLRPGQLVCIVPADPTLEDLGDVYRYDGLDAEGDSTWSFVGKIGNLQPVNSLDSDSTQLPLAAAQGKVLDGKISQLGQKSSFAVGGNLVADIPFSKIIDSNGDYQTPVSDAANLLDVSKIRGETISVVAGATQNTIIAFLKSDDISSGSAKFSMLACERVIIPATTTETFVIPEDCVYLYVRWKANGVVEVPTITVTSSIATGQKKLALPLDEQENLVNLLDWRLRGTFVNSTATTTTGTSRIYGIIPDFKLPYKIKYKAPNGYRLAISVWDGVTYPAPSVGSGWLYREGTYEFTQNGLAWITLAKSDDSSISLSDVSNYEIKVWNNNDSAIASIQDTLPQLQNVSGEVNSGILLPNISFDKIITGAGAYDNKTLNNYAKLLDVTALRGSTISISKNLLNNAIYAFLADDDITSSPHFCFGETGRRVITSSDVDSVVVPLDCKYLYAVVYNNGMDATPTIIADVSGKTEETGNITLAVNSELKGKIKWYENGVDTSTGNISAGAGIRIVGALYNIPIGTIINVKIPFGYDVGIYDWSDSYPKESGTAWQATISFDYTVLRGSKIIIILRKRDNTAISLSLLDNVSVKLVGTTRSNMLPIIDKASKGYKSQLPCVWQYGVLNDLGTVDSSNFRVFAVVDMRNFDISSVSYYTEDFKIYFRPWDGYAPITSSSSGWLFGQGVYSIPANTKFIIVAAQRTDTNYISSLDELNELKLFIDTEAGEVAKDVHNIPIKDYYYSGERITIEHTFRTKMFARYANWKNMQGGAIFGNYLVCLMATDELTNPSANGFIYNLATGAKHCDLLFGSTLGGKTYTMPHANQVSFGTQFYNEDSQFPLLYVSQVNGSTPELWESSERGVLAYDLQTSDNGETFTPVLVQAIIPDLDDVDLMAKIGKYTPNYIVDTDKEQFVILGYPNESWTDLTGAQPVAIIDIPSIDAGNEVVFTNSDVVDSYTFPVSLGIQQSTYYKGKIYSLGGTSEEPSLRVIDLANKSVVTTIDLAQWLGEQEPQFIGIYSHKVLYYSTGENAIIWQIIF